MVEKPFGRDRASAAELDEVRRVLAERRGAGEARSHLFGVAEGRNLIVVMVESLQAFPIGVENGPTWKDAIKAPETGTVTAIIELEEIVEDWHAAQPNDKLRTIVTHHSGEDATGLGPPLSIRYHWSDEHETDPTD